MQQAPEITFRDIPHSPSVENHILDEIDKLSHYADNIISCHVVLALSQNNCQHGKLHNVRVTLSVPNKQIVSNLNHDENLYLGVRQSFDDMRRQLKDYMEKLHGSTKHHAPQLPGTVVRLFSDQGFGFIEGLDGNEYYFNAGYVHRQKFYKMHVGDTVRFVIGQGDDGLQAQRVSLLSQAA